MVIRTVLRLSRFRMMHLAPAAVCLALLAGCGRPATVITGVVTLDEELVPNALIELFPLSGRGKVSVATTDASGRYRAVVTPTEMSVVIYATKLLGTKRDVGGMPTPDVHNLLPTRYNSHKTSPLKAVPVEQQTVTVDFNMSSAD
jgi:hypothetical protein